MELESFHFPGKKMSNKKYPQKLGCSVKKKLIKIKMRRTRAV